VRDTLLGRTPKDYDIATAAHPDRVLALFPGAVEVGKSFGVVRAPVADTWIEIATFRQDRGYSDGRRPDAVVYTDAPSDAQRRDFTINAMFLDPCAGTLLDYVQGRADLTAGQIRCVGAPAERFAEDHLRMLRAVRFAATLGFTIEPATCAAIRDGAAQILKISPERIRDELVRTLCEARRAGAALRLLDESGLLAPVLPEVAAMKGVEQPPEFHPEGDVFTHTVELLDRMREPTPVLAMASLLHDIGKPPTAKFEDGRWRFYEHADVGARMTSIVMRRLRFSNADEEAVVACVAGHMRFQDVQRMKRSTLRRLIGRPTFETELELHRLDCEASHGGLDNHVFLKQARAEFASEPVLPQPWVTGADLMALGVPHGPDVGRWKQAAYEAQIEGRFPNRDALLAWLRGEMARGCG
jgi:poly(A) polymerase